MNLTSEFLNNFYFSHKYVYLLKIFVDIYEYLGPDKPSLVPFI